MQEVLLPLDEADQVCGLCGGALQEWTGQTEDSEEITVVERHFVLRTTTAEVPLPQGCAPVTAPAPPRLMEGGRYSVEFAVHVALQKYGFHLPLARQERMFEREGLVVEQPDAVGPAGRAGPPPAAQLRGAARGRFSPRRSFTRMRRTGRCWTRGPGRSGTRGRWPAPDAVYHRILPSRSGATARQVLGDYAGVVMVDGYAAYQTATKSGADGPAPATLAFCWAHVRRKFVEAQKFAPACAEVLALIGQLYAIEADLPDWHALEGERNRHALAHRLAVRQQQSAPLVERIREWALAQRALPGSAFRKALEYMLALWSGLTVFLANPGCRWTTTTSSGSCATWWWAARTTTAASPSAAPRWRPSSTRSSRRPGCAVRTRALPAARRPRRHREPGTVTLPSSAD